MRKFATVFLGSVILSLMLCGCGNKSEESVQTQNQATSMESNSNESSSNETKEEEIAKKTKTQLNFGEWQDVGNDPNNIWHSYTPLAFDDNYIYYSSYSENSGNTRIYRMNYDGTGNTPLYVVEDEARFLNVYNGSLYFAQIGKRRNDGEMESYYTIKKLDPVTLEETVLIDWGSDDFYHDYGISSMLVAYDFIFYTVVDTDTSNVTSVMAYSLEASTSCYLVGALDVTSANITVDNDKNFYIFMPVDSERSRILKTNVDTLYEELDQTSGYTVQEIVAAREFGPYASHVMAPNGFLMNNRYTDSCSYSTYLWSDVDTESKELTLADCDIRKIEEDDFYYNLHTYRNTRFVIGESLVLFENDVWVTAGDTKKTKTFICPDFDVRDVNGVGVLGGISMYLNVENRFGVWDDKLYILETKEDGDYLNVINPEGELTTTKIM